jgi:hypothetical protein
MRAARSRAMRSRILRHRRQGSNSPPIPTELGSTLLSRSRTPQDPAYWCHRPALRKVSARLCDRHGSSGCGGRGAGSCAPRRGVVEQAECGARCPRISSFTRNTDGNGAEDAVTQVVRVNARLSRDIGGGHSLRAQGVQDLGQELAALSGQQGAGFAAAVSRLGEFLDGPSWRHSDSRPRVRSRWARAMAETPQRRLAPRIRSTEASPRRGAMMPARSMRKAEAQALASGSQVAEFVDCVEPAAFAGLTRVEEDVRSACVGGGESVRVQAGSPVHRACSGGCCASSCRSVNSSPAVWSLTPRRMPGGQHTDRPLPHRRPTRRRKTKPLGTWTPTGYVTEP